MSEVHPQAGSQDHLDRHEGHEEAAATSQAAPTSVEPVTPQDTHAAGAGTGKQQEFLRKNVSGSEQKGAAENAKDMEHQQPGGTSGIHSTGSSTGASGGQGN